MAEQPLNVPLTSREAHVVLRALAAYNNENIPKEDKEPTRWVAQRLLRLVSPELGVHPIEAIMAVEAIPFKTENPVRKNRRSRKK